MQRHPLPPKAAGAPPGTAFYNLLFDAFWNGQLSLRVEPDPALADLSNPYDRSQRGDILTLWDTSYYNGKYYSHAGELCRCLCPALPVGGCRTARHGVADVFGRS